MLITCLSVPELYLPDFIVPRRFGQNALLYFTRNLQDLEDLNLGHNPIGYATGGVSCRIKLLVASEELFGSTKRDVSELGLLVQPLAVPWGCSREFSAFGLWPFAREIVGLLSNGPG